MGVIYIDGGYKKAKLPVDLKQASVDINGGSQGVDISVEDGNMIISSENIEQDKIVKDEILNIL